MPVHPLGNRDLIRAINRSAVLNMIKAYGPISRKEIAHRSGLSAATVTGITADLRAEGLVFEKARGDSHKGRPPILLALNPRGGYVVGLKLTESHVIGALTDLEATILAKRTVQLAGHGQNDAVEALAEAVRALLADGRIRRSQILRGGGGRAGTVDAERGVLRQSPHFGWRNVPLGEMLQRRVRVPVWIDNDVNTLTLAEKWFGEGHGIDDFLTVTVGRGVGMGIVVNGQVYRGMRGGAGEFGHTVIEPDGPPCDCGKRGCLEAFVADPALLRLAAQAVARGEIPPPIDRVADLLARAEAG